MGTRGLHHLLTETDRIQIRLAALNDCAPKTARAQFKCCCNSSKWIQRMEQARPFSDLEELEACADRIWASCSREDWLEAFAGHPKIGEQSESRWSRQEQSSVTAADPSILAALAEANRTYERKFGYIFIVCATSRSASELLAMLNERLNNDTEMEIHNAAEQQRLILHVRLRKMLSE